MIRNGLPTGVKASLPYRPSLDNILYVEGARTIKVEKWQLEFYKDIVNDSLRFPTNYANGYVDLIIKIIHNPSLWPNFSEEAQREGIAQILLDFNFWEYVDAERTPTPSIFIYDATLNDGRYKFRQFEVGENGLTNTLNEVLAYMDQRDYIRGVDYEKTSNIDIDRREIIRQLQENVKKLINTGMTQEEVKTVLFEEPQPLFLHITKDFKILLEKYLGKIQMVMAEINLAPLDKAIYLLYLRHPEGINFSYLPDYREELMEIYKQLMDYRTNTAMRRSIEDVTDPIKNSINEKCARIRRAFSNALGAYRAEAYCITGKRGDVKRITLDRHYVLVDDLELKQ